MTTPPLDELHVQNPVMSFPGTKHLDYEKVNSLDDEAFLSVHRQLMETYRGDGWWVGRNIPSCYRCHDPITGPETLIRYFGGSYDPPCFKEVWRDERGHETKRNPGFGRYLDRLVELLVDNGG